MVMEEQDIPIDINSGKLLEWLINRRHCPKDWQPKILKIREKINNAIQDMPEHQEIAKLLTGTHINYFHCQKIINILKETEADTKNLFGRYGSQRMKDWQEIVKMYEKENLYLAEAAQILVRNINFEVPGFKKQIQKLEQIQEELGKKESEYKKSENIARSEFNNLCKQLGISGNSIKRELVDLIKELPPIYDLIAKKTKKLEDVVEFYEAFVDFTLGRPYTGGCVPMVKYIIEKGNTTTYEWTYGEAPLAIKDSNLEFDFEDDEDNNDNAIDFGNETGGIDFSAIDFGDEVQLEEAGDIDWGAGMEDPVPNNVIDFDISLEESGIVVEDAGNDGGTASGAEALTILDNPDIRNDFINQLFELESFLKIRLYELRNDKGKNLLNTSQMQEASPVLQMATTDSIQNMLDCVQITLSEILHNKVQHLHNIKHSPRYLDTLTDSLKQKQKVIKKMKSLQQSMKDKQAEAQQQIQTIRPILKVVISKTKELQQEIEKDISNKYKNRVVRLSGSINTL